MNVRRGGERGTPLVFVHGWAMSGAVWKKQLDYFAPSHRVFAVDLPGHGLSAPLEEPLTIRRCGEEVARFLDEEQLKGAALIGWSLGTQAVCHAALLNPARVAKLALVSGTPCFTAPSKDDRWGTPAGKTKWFARQMATDFENTLRESILAFFVHGEVLSPDDRAAIGELVFAHPPDRASVLDLLADLHAADIREELRRLAVQSLIVHGRGDRIIPVEVTGVWSGLLTSRANIVLAPGCGHAPFLTRPEFFNRVLETFLE